MRWSERFRVRFLGSAAVSPKKMGLGELVLDAGESLPELLVRLKWTIAGFAALALGLWAIPYASEPFLALWIFAMFAVGIGSRVANRPADVRFYEYGLRGSLQTEGGNGWTNPPRTRLLRYDALVSVDLVDRRMLTLWVQDPETLDRTSFAVPIPPSRRAAVESLMPAMRRRPAHLTPDDVPKRQVRSGSGW